MHVLVPAHGREYRHPDDVGEAYQRGDDFLRVSPCGSEYCSIRDFPNEKVEIRFDREQKFVII